MSIVNRLLQIADSKGISANKLAQKIGVSNAYFSRQKANNANVGSQILLKIVSIYPEISTDWLVKGEGEMFASKNEVSKLASEHTKKIPFYDNIANNMGEGVSDFTLIDPGTFLKGATGALRVFGDSMWPNYPSGCVVTFRMTGKEVIRYGEDYLIELEDGRIIKRIEKSAEKGHIKAVSYNTEQSSRLSYDSFDIPLTHVKALYLILDKIESKASK